MFTKKEQPEPVPVPERQVNQNRRNARVLDEWAVAEGAERPPNFQERMLRAMEQRLQRDNARNQYLAHPVAANLQR